MNGDRGACWLLVRREGERSRNLLRSILRDQDTVTLATWKKEMTDLMGELQDEMNSRKGDDNYPKHGMRE